MDTNIVIFTLKAGHDPAQVRGRGDVWSVTRGLVHCAVAALHRGCVDQRCWAFQHNILVRVSTRPPQLTHAVGSTPPYISAPRHVSGL